MEPIRLIEQKSELRGTCYIEFLPGKYAGRCWNDGSVFLDEEVFGLIEPKIIAQVPEFDHYAFIEIQGEVWNQIIRDLRDLSERLKSAQSIDDLAAEIGFFFVG